MTQRPHALVIGGSVGGLFAALLLRQIGWDVTVFERASDDLATRGAGAGMSAELFDIMRRIGISLDQTIGVTVRYYACVDQRGDITHEITRHSVNGAWAKVFRPLRAYLPSECYRTGMALELVREKDAKVVAVFADGVEVEGDLLIGADGGYSTVRQQFLPQVTHQYAGYVAWRGLLVGSELPENARELLQERIAFSIPEGELMLSMPVPGKGESLSSGQRGNYFIWYRPVDFDQELPELCTDAGGHCHGITIAPTLICPEVIAKLRDSAEEHFAPALASLVHRVKQPLLQPIFDLESPQLVFGRTLLMGDAAFIARPHVAAGITKAALNALTLADALRDTGNDIDEALRRYEAQSLTFGRQMVSHARYLGQYLDAKIAGSTVLAERSAPETYLKEYGAPHLINDPSAPD